ncbi:MAG TPA: ice-binding family protein [Candidatus Limnocylindrales bacterium]|nr:ice-binding family protein [Candidatus Limnocylindrales bacterium]
MRRKAAHVLNMKRLTMKKLAGAATIASLLAIGTIAAAATPVGLGAATSFVVLAGAGVTNTGPTTLNGDIGTFPTTSITGAASLTVNGVNHGGDGVTQQAKTDLITAYNNAGQGPASPIVSDLGGLTLVPGIYSSASSLGLTGNLTLNGGGDPNAVFIFQAGSTLTTATGSSVSFTNGARACNVFWRIGSSATLGTGSSFSGTIIAQQSITVTTGASVTGRVLAENGAVTLDTNTISIPSCPTAVSPPAAATATPTPSASAVVTATPSSATATPSSATATPSSPTATPSSATATPVAAAAAATPRASQLPSTSTAGDLPIGPIAAMFIALAVFITTRRLIAGK